MIIGLGTVGTAVVKYLLQLGIKKFVLFDGDKVEEKNLLHQNFFTHKHIGENKAATIEKEINKLISTEETISFNENLHSIDQLKNIPKPDAVFCCFDNNSSNFLEKVLNHFQSLAVPVYISGYILGLAKAVELNHNLLQENRIAEQNITDWINSNSSIGVMGDLAAILMCRLWLQKVIPQLPTFPASASFDFLNYTHANESNILDKYTSFPFEKRTDFFEKKFYESLFIVPFMQQKYLQYLLEYNEFSFDSIRNVNDEHGLSIIDNSRDQDQYEEFLNTFRIVSNSKSYSMDEFAFALLQESNIDMSALSLFIENQKKISSLAVEMIKKKKIALGSKYIEKIKSRPLIKSALFETGIALSKEIYNSGMIDYRDYKPFGIRYGSLDLALQLICRIENAYWSTNISEFIDFSLNCHLIRNSDQCKQALTLWNPRHGISYILINYRESYKDLLLLTHEIGHAYYNSFLQKGIVHEGLSPIISETLAILLEFKLFFSLINESLLNDRFIDAFIQRIQGALIGMFSLDCYEEAILDLEIIDVEHIPRARENLIKEFFAGIKIINDEYSQYNFTLSRDLLFEEREMFLYAESLLLGFSIAKELFTHPEKEISLVNYLKNMPADKIEINKILSFFFEIENYRDFLRKSGSELIETIRMIQQR